MRKEFILIPLLLLGVKPYYQVNAFMNNRSNDSISQLAKDTAFFPIMEMDIKIQKEISESLDKRLEKANQELKRLQALEKRKKQEKALEKRQLKEIEQMFNDFENRGL